MDRLESSREQVSNPSMGLRKEWHPRRGVRIEEKEDTDSEEFSFMRGKGSTQW